MNVNSVSPNRGAVQASDFYSFMKVAELFPAASNSMGDSRGDVGVAVFVVVSESTLEMSIDSSKPSRIF